MTNVKFQNNYDLEERTAVFGEQIIQFCRKAKRDQIVISLLTQLVRSATSIGANYMEANGASSPKDFANKVYICKKEAQESKQESRKYWKEAQEFVLIFHKIVSTLKIKNSLKILK